MILEQHLALPLERGVDHPGEHAEHGRKEHLQVDLGVLDIDGSGNRLPHGGDVEVELVAGPAGVDLRTPGNLVLELVHVVGDPAPRLVLAEVVRKIDFDGLSHCCDVGGRSALFKLPHESMVSVMKLVLASLLFLASAASAQPVAAPAQPQPAQQPAIATPWDPAAQYITAGQDEPGYRSWYMAAPWRAAQVKSFNDYLVANEVGGVLPTWQLLRTATAWQECGQQPFEVPPTEDWPHMVETLRYIRDYVIPAVGPVEPVSVYRNPQLNKCAGGAPESAHRLDSAIDMVPLRTTTREALMKTLCGIHSEHGAPYNAGLGFYAYLRFHVDSTKFRRWNMDPAVAADCPPLLHPEDAANSGQPLPPAPATAPAANAPAPAAALSPPPAPPPVQNTTPGQPQ